MDEQRLSELLEEVKAAIRAAGEVLLQHQGSGNRQWDKGEDDPVSLADLASDRLLRGRLLNLGPEFGWYSEETSTDPSQLESDWVWVVDPLDGTKEFLNQIPEYAVSVGLLYRGVPKLGVVYNPATEEMFAGAGDTPVEYQGRRVGVSKQAEITPGVTTVAVSSSEHKRGEFDTVADEMDLYPMGSVAYKLARVAAGQMDCFYTLTPRSIWDICAGVYLVQAAGGRATEKGGESLAFDRPTLKIRSLVAANPGLHARLLEYLAAVPLAPDRRG